MSRGPERATRRQWVPPYRLDPSYNRLDLIFTNAHRMLAAEAAPLPPEVVRQVGEDWRGVKLTDVVSGVLVSAFRDQVIKTRSLNSKLRHRHDRPPKEWREQQELQCGNGISLCSFV